MPDIDWSSLSNEQIRELMDDGREEIDSRIRLLGEALNGSPKGPGRPRKNGVTQLTAADLKDADS